MLVLLLRLHLGSRDPILLALRNGVESLVEYLVRFLLFLLGQFLLGCLVFLVFGQVLVEGLSEYIVGLIIIRLVTTRLNK